MIIKFPTGLFKTVLPTEYSSGNVIFTVSNNNPPRIPATTLQLPFASTVRTRETDVTDQERRLAVGSLVFTVTTGLKPNPGSNKKAFEIGQFLNFDDQTFTSNDPIKVPTDIVIQHNTNLLDLNASGLDETQIGTLLSKSVEKFNIVKRQLADRQSEAADLKVQITENQKAINEQNKIIGVAKVVLSVDDPIYVELNAKLVELQQERDVLIAAQAAKNAETEVLYNQLLTISTVVK